MQHVDTTNAGPSSWRFFAIAAALSAAGTLPASGQSYGSFAVESPAPIVHGTVPFAPGELRRDAKQQCPLVLVAPDGTKLRTQVETVATWPDGSVRVAEILAAAPPAQGRRVYTVEADARRVERAQPAPWAQAWTESAPKLYLDDRPHPIAWTAGWHRRGPVASTRRFHDRNLFGWVTTYHALDVVTLDLVLHNAHPGSPALVFDSITLDDHGSGAVACETAWPSPGVANVGGSVSIVSPRGDAYGHTLVQRGAHWWSLVLHDGSGPSAQLARSMAGGAGWGVSSRWTSVDAYGCAAIRLPSMPLRVASLASDARAEWAEISSALASGSPFGLFGSGTAASGPGRLDWQHPYAPMDGGSTGGARRRQWYGMEGALSGEPAALRTWRATLAMVMDRQASLILRADGSPVALEEWLDANGSPMGGWRASSADSRFDGSSDGAFGFAAAQSTVDQRTPPEFAKFRQPIAGGGSSSAFEPIDYQHWDRAMQDAEVLAFLDNSPVAAWWLRANVETWRMSQFSAGRLQSEWSSAIASPGRASWAGREHGHGYRFACVAFALSSQKWRAQWATYFQRFGEAMVAAQTPAGLYQARVRKESQAPPFGDGVSSQWWIAKGTEEALLANALLGVARSTSVTNGAQIIESVDRWTRSGLWDYLWRGGSTGMAPTNYIGVARVVGGGKGPIETDAQSVPRSGVDGEEITSPLGSMMVLRLANGAPIAPEQLAAALKWCGNTSDAAAALAWCAFKSNYQIKLDDCAPLISALQMSLSH